MGQMKKVTPAALAFSSSITSVEKENPSLNIKNGQVPEESFNFNRCN
ncbi:hypothetical protein [Bacillus sp. SH5-2]|nr:hypothetical protein [Bacillus sp. SH5-2]